MGFSYQIKNNAPAIERAMLSAMESETQSIVTGQADLILDTNVKMAQAGQGADGTAFKSNRASTIKAKKSARALYKTGLLMRMSSYRVKYNQSTKMADVLPIGTYPNGQRLRDVIRYLQQSGYYYWMMPTTGDFKAKSDRISRKFSSRVMRKIRR